MFRGVRGEKQGFVFVFSHALQPACRGDSPGLLLRASTVPWSGGLSAPPWLCRVRAGGEVAASALQSAQQHPMCGADKAGERGE